jgi:hypothetical protein
LAVQKQLRKILEPKRHQIEDPAESETLDGIINGSLMILWEETMKRSLDSQVPSTYEWNVYIGGLKMDKANHIWKDEELAIGR